MNARYISPCTFMYLCVLCYCDACLKSSALRVGSEDLIQYTMSTGSLTPILVLFTSKMKVWTFWYIPVACRGRRTGRRSRASKTRGHPNSESKKIKICFGFSNAAHIHLNFYLIASVQMSDAFYKSSFFLSFLTLLHVSDQLQ